MSSAVSAMDPAPPDFAIGRPATPMSDGRPPNGAPKLTVSNGATTVPDSSGVDPGQDWRRPAIARHAAHRRDVPDRGPVRGRCLAGGRSGDARPEPTDRQAMRHRHHADPGRVRLRAVLQCGGRRPHCGVGVPRRPAGHRLDGAGDPVRVDRPGTRSRAAWSPPPSVDPSGAFGQAVKGYYNPIPPRPSGGGDQELPGQRQHQLRRAVGTARTTATSTPTGTRSLT